MPEPSSSSLIIDSISDSYARIEATDGTTIEIPTSWLPLNAKEGDVISIAVELEKDKSVVAMLLNPEATKVTRDRIRDKLNKLRERS